MLVLLLSFRVTVLQTLCVVLPELTEEENFVYCFNTLLSDIATLFPSVRYAIISAQLKLMEVCAVAMSKLEPDIQFPVSPNKGFA